MALRLNRSAETRRNAGHSDNNKEQSLQRTEVLIGDVEQHTQHRNQRNENLARRKIDKIN